MADSSDGNSELVLGHEGAGDDCIGKIIDHTGRSFLAGESSRASQSSVRYLEYLCCFSGGAIGATEGCFLNPVPGNSSPMIFRCLKLMLQRSILFGNIN
jgi:hypothetical protein